MTNPPEPVPPVVDRFTYPCGDRWSFVPVNGQWRWRLDRGWRTPQVVDIPVEPPKPPAIDFPSWAATRRAQ